MYESGILAELVLHSILGIACGILGAAYRLLTLALGLVGPAFFLHLFIVGEVAGTFFGFALVLIDLAFGLFFTSAHGNVSFRVAVIHVSLEYDDSNTHVVINVYAPQAGLGRACSVMEALCNDHDVGDNTGSRDACRRSVLSATLDREDEFNMSGIPRMPREGDPRRPRKQREDEPSGLPARSYGQSAEPPKRGHDDIDEFEDLTDEPVREGDDEPSTGAGPSSSKRKRELREFEDLAGEPVLDDEEDEKP
jgi:hypothetical protein